MFNADVLYNRQTQRINQIIPIESNELIINWADGFLLDCKVRGLSKGTLRFYKQKLQLFFQYCELQQIVSVYSITANMIRGFLDWLSTNHNPGGCHAAYRTLKAFLRWYRNENELISSPIDRIKSPRVPNIILDPVSIEDVRLLLSVCENERDKAIILLLLDTGIRASVLLALNIEDVNSITGSIIIKHGKGDKTRMVFIGSKTRRALRAYLKMRKLGFSNKDLGLEFEPNVKLWGLRETIESSGRACLYEIGDESDTIAGVVTTGTNF